MAVHVYDDAGKRAITFRGDLRVEVRVVLPEHDLTLLEGTRTLKPGETIQWAYPAEGLRLDAS